MKEDILEQLVEDWLIRKSGWFVKHNLKFRPAIEDEGYVSRLDSVHSDIDLLAIHGTKKGIERVRVFTCKSWQGGFDSNWWLRELEKEAFYNEPSESFKRREAWKSFRELVSSKWMKAFVERIELETGQRDFTYYIAVTKLIGKADGRMQLEGSKIIRERFEKLGSSMNIQVITLEDIVQQYLERVRNSPTAALESTDVGRLLQLMSAAKLNVNF